MSPAVTPHPTHAQAIFSTLQEQGRASWMPVGIGIWGPAPRIHQHLQAAQMLIDSRTSMY